MEPKAKVVTRAREVEVTLLCASFETALEVALRNYERPPVGYRLNRIVVRRRNHSGRRMVLELGFFQIDRRIPPIDEAEAKDVFELDVKVAAGLDEYPAEDS